LNTQRWEEVQVSFDELVELDATERVGRLATLAISDPELHRALESLLQADAEADAHLAPVDAALQTGFAKRSDPLGLVGRTISHFHLHEALGAGGMGVVYSADDTQLGRAVALKFLLPHYNLDASAKARFLGEAHAAAALDHPNLCTIYEVGTSDEGWLFIAMALYNGETLRARLSREGPLPAGETLEITRQIAEGLQAAHAAGFVHRDLKPSNIMLLPDGTVRILDFGLAKARDHTLSATSVRFGTVSYMSPEQIRAGNLDGRADLWALGVVIYEMLTGRKPFRGHEKALITHAILHDQPEPPSIHRRELPKALEGIVLRLLEKDPTRRHATAAELLRDLARTQTTRPLPAFADRYRIEREIGSGGMATVYLARDLKHDRDVALKVLRPDLAAMLGSDRFLNEIKISARLDHPHILTLIDSGAADGFLYYVMPFVRGESLRDRLKREKELTVDEALDITRQITSALDYAHRQGIVHRDIKPENILIHEGEAVLTDFGIAMAVKEAGGNRLTESGVSLGTPQYMSPEQATGDRVLDSRTDVYSMAAVLYEMLTGEPPHSGASVQTVVARLLTEPPTRLRVLRDTVPDGIDVAVTKALAKLPADRYANAGDFARAMATPAALRRPSRRVRRWFPIAIGGAVVTVAGIVAALSLARKSAAPPPPDRIQLTLTGRAVAPSLSPDGTRVAFGEKQCNETGYCTYQVVIQDTDGSSRLVLTRNVGYIYKTQWTRDGRFLVFAGSYPPSRQGAFAVSTLGGETRFLGCCIFDLLSGDTAFLHVGSLPGVNRAWVRRITVHDGQTLDSIPVRDSRAPYYIIALSIPDRLIVAAGKTSESAHELRLTDFRGRVINRITSPFGSLGRSYGARWVPARRKLVIASQREFAGTEFDILAMDVTASGIQPDVDTVFSGLQLGNGIFDVSRDGERLLYYAGPVETSLSTIDVGRASPPRLPATQVLSSTTLLRGRISPAGDKIFLARDAPRAGGHASQFSLIPRDGGAESQIPGAVENLLDFGWSPDGARVMYLHGIGGNKIRLMEPDTTGHGTREIARLEQSAATQFYPLPDGAVCIMPGGRRSISIIGRPGKRDVTWHVPDWISVIGSISPSSDAKSLSVLGVNRSFDSVVAATLDIESGRSIRIGIFAGSDPQKITWLEDGSIMIVFREPESAWAVYRIAQGRPARRLGRLPYTQAEFSVSTDGRYMAEFGYSDKNDVYMIRNFGKMLR
jgi:serine/threonine protein kinase